MSRVKNKRGNKRKNCLVQVDGKKGSKFSDVQTVDISSGGLGLVTKRKLGLDEKIAVEIETSPENEPILVMGKVVWVQKLSEEDRYRVGLKFQKAFSSNARQKLSRLTTV